MLVEGNQEHTVMMRKADYKPQKIQKDPVLLVGYLWYSYRDSW